MTKFREEALNELANAKEMINKNPFLIKAFPELIAKLTSVYNDLLYNEVSQKKGDAPLFGRKQLVAVKELLKEVKTFSTLTVSKFDTPLKTLGDRRLFGLPYETAKQQLLAQINTSGVDSVYNDYLRELNEHLEADENGKLSDILDIIKSITENYFGNLEPDRLDNCNSLKAIKDLNERSISHIIDNYGKQYAGLTSLNSPNSLLWYDTIVGKYQEIYMLTQSDFEKNIRTWVAQMSAMLKSMVNNQNAEIEIDINKLINQIDLQFSKFTVAILSETIKNAFIAFVQNVANSLEVNNVQNFCKALSVQINNFKAPVFNIENALEIENENELYIQNQLTQNFNISTIVNVSINLNSFTFVVNQPNFEANFIKEVNTWTANFALSLVSIKETVMHFDSIKIDALKFISELKLIFKPNMSFLLEIILKGLAALKTITVDKLGKSFQVWINLWQTIINSLNVTDIYKHLSADKKNIYNISLDFNNYFPFSTLVIQAVYNSITAIDHANSAKLNALQSQITSLGHELKYIAAANNNAAKAQQAPKTLQPLIALISKNISTIVKNHEAARVAFESGFCAAVEQMKAITKATTVAFATLMFGSVKKLFDKGFKTDKFPVISKSLSELVKLGAEKVYEWGDSGIRGEVKTFDLIPNAENWGTTLVTYFEEVMTLSDKYTCIMHGHVSSVTDSATIGNSGAKAFIDQRVFEDLETQVRLFEECIVSIVKELTELNDTLQPFLRSAQEYEAKMIVTAIDDQRSILFFNPGASWYNGYNFDLLYSDAFLDIVEKRAYGIVSKSEVRKLINAVSGTGSNFWEGVKNAASAITKNTDKFEALRVIISNMLASAKSYRPIG